MDFNISVYDESLSLYGALRVFHGQLPYRDFWTMYPPGEFYALALAFRLFGVLAIWDRAIFIAANALTAIAILYILSRITGRPWLSRFATFATLLWLSARPSYAFPIYPSLTFILIATACMLRRWRDGNTRPVLWAGAALGVSAVFRHDLALYALISLSLASIIHQLDFPRPRREHVWTDPLRLSLAALLIVSPVLILLLIRVPSHDLYYDLLYVPGVIYPKVRSLPFPNLAQILHGFRHPYALNPPMQGDIEYNIVWLPPLVVLASLIMLLENRRHRTLPAWTATNLVCLTLLTALLFLKGFVRVSPLHMVPGIVPALILLACLVARLPAMGAAAGASVLFAAAWALPCLFATTHHDYFVFRQNLRSVRGTEPDHHFAEACHRPEDLSRARCLFLPRDEQQAILFLQSQTKPQEPIFVGVPRYDILHLSDIEIYFFSKREAGTRWYDLHPGVETTAPIQTEMIRELEHNRVRFIVRDNLIYPDEPNQSRFSSGVNLLGDYISANYAPQRAFGDLEVLKRTGPFAESDATAIENRYGVR